MWTKIWLNGRSLFVSNRFNPEIQLADAAMPQAASSDVPPGPISPDPLIFGAWRSAWSRRRKLRL